MFEHPIFEIYPADEIPLDTDLYLRDEMFIDEFESSLLKLENGGEWVSVGYVMYLVKFTWMSIISIH
jgi:hypothetical protein